MFAQVLFLAQAILSAAAPEETAAPEIVSVKVAPGASCALITDICPADLTCLDAPTGPFCGRVSMTGICNLEDGVVCPANFVCTKISVVEGAQSFCLKADEVPAPTERK